MIGGLVSNAGSQMRIVAVQWEIAIREPDQRRLALFLGYVGLALLVAAGVATIFSDGAQARVAGRWSEFRARRGGPKFTEVDGPEI